MYSNKFIKEVDLEYKNYSLKTRDREYNLYTDADYYFEEIRKNYIINLEKIILLRGINNKNIY